jgi:electron transfer flavoprotein alpha subunit
MAEYKGVLIYAEVTDGGIAAITAELLGIGRRLADDLGEELSALLVGSGIADAAKEVIAFGGDKVYVVDHPLLASYNSTLHSEVATKLCQEINPSIFLLGQTDMGRDLAPRLATRLGGGLCMDCIELSIDPETKLLTQIRPVYGGNAHAVMVCRTARPQMATVRAKAMKPLEGDDSRQGESIPIEAAVDASAIKTKVVARKKEEALGVKLEDADIIVSGGRGIGGTEGFKVIWELASVLGGAVGATRAACDEGWVPAVHHIGLTGKVVTPTLYIAVALSGASQHLAGCSGAKNIVAINTDPEANIFKVARYGVIGDYREAMPALIQRCKELLAR